MTTAGEPPPSATSRPRFRSRSSVLVEFVRLGVVALATAGAYELATAGSLPGIGGSDERLVLAVVVLGALVGYLLGGVFGRFTLGRIDAAERSLRSVSTGELLAGGLGAVAGLVVGLGLTWPVLLLSSGRSFLLPLAVFVVLLTVTVGLRIGAGRGGDLLRALGASGRLAVASPASGPRARLVDTSALIDGRIVDVCRSGFLDGTLVIPRFVLYELQGLADAGDAERRARGLRGLDVLGALQRAAPVSIEVDDRDYPDVTAVDAKLVVMARERKLALLTVDGNLTRVAEVQGVTVLNLHQLAEHLRPPVLPGDTVTVRIARPGKEAKQGVGYLSDGTMVVVEQALDRQGLEVSAEVTSILSNPNGRMVFATAEPVEVTAGRMRLRAAE